MGEPKPKTMLVELKILLYLDRDGYPCLRLENSAVGQTVTRTPDDLDKRDAACGMSYCDELRARLLEDVGDAFDELVEEVSLG